MCMPTSCRCCLICLLVYLLLPNYSANSRSLPDPMETTDTTYVPLVDKDQNDPDETKFLQLSLNEDNSTDHNHDASQPQHYFVHLLMEKYGDGIDMAFEGFEHLLVNIGLGKFLQFDHSVKCHKINGSSFVALHSDHNHTGEIHSDAFNRSCDGVQSHVTHSHDHHVSEDDDDHRDHTGHKHETGHEQSEKGHVHDHTETDHEHENTETGHEYGHKETGHEHTETGHEHDHTETGHEHDHSDTETDHEHDHTETDHEHDHTETDHEHDHTETDHQHTETGHEHDHTETGHEHEHTETGHEHEHSDTETGHEHEHTETDHEHDLLETDHEHEHTETDHEHDHTETDHEHTETGHAHEHTEADHEHDHTETDHEHEHTETGHEHEHTETDHEHTKILDSREGSENTEVKKDLVADAEKQCLTPKMMVNMFGEAGYKSVSEELFISLCPILIYQLDKKLCTSPQIGSTKGHVEGHHRDDQEPETKAGSGEVSEYNFANIPARVWGFSVIAVVVISFTGLLGVAVIPILQKEFYNHVLQFLVALGVGTLSADALLHLLPHAIEGGHSGEDEGHGHGHSMTGVYKGLCGLMGIFFFFLMERILTIFTDIKRKRKQKTKRKRKHLKYTEDIEEKLPNGDMECGEMMMSIHPNKALMGYADEAHREHCDISYENTTTISHQHGSRSANNKHGNNHGNHVHGEDEEPMISHSSLGHGHGHSHCHDDVPNSVSALAWMLILGDGIHNLTDGLAIGAAFSNSITGGFSTAIAIFCHEVPHEIGDFAILLRAGMSVKQAILYSSLSSILCFIGMAIGVAIGNIHEASLWVFAIVGGMFLYIALVDMLPEMTSVATQKGENPFKHLFLQLLGLLLGAGIMLVIALKEEDLLNALG